MSPREHFDFAALLSRLSPFSGIPADALEDLEDRFFFKRAQRGELVIPDCSSDHTMYLLRNGTVSCELVLPSGAILLKKMGPGDLFGNPLGSADIPVRFTATEDSGILFIREESLRRHLERYPHTHRVLADYASGLLRETYETVALLSEGDVEERLRRLLGRLASRSGRNTGRVLELELTYTQKELASMIGARRETVSRILSRLKSTKQIKRKGRTIYMPAEWANSGVC